MKIEIKDLENSQKQIDIVLTPSDMERFVSRVVDRLSKDIKIKGFRQGHIPRNVVENHLGREVIFQEAAEEAIQDNYVYVIEKNNIEPIGRPDIKILKIAYGNDFEFRIVVPLLPKIDLPDYKAIAKNILTKHKVKMEVEDKEVDSALEWLRNSRVKDKDKKPELDDKFAQEIGEFKTLEGLKQSLREGMMEEKKYQERQKLRLLILEAVGNKIKVKLPDSLIEQELDKMQDELSQQIASMDMTLDKYLENAKQNLKEVRDGWRDKANQRTVNSLLLRLIADKEGFVPDEKEVEDEANRYLIQFGSSKEAEKQIDPDALRVHIRGIIRNEKVFELLEAVNVK
ncbi:MAG: hypothetical protein A3F94_02635 [Candidatus Spechtbacteria bacterium RIFCSPLOWO2_12_FULL_38_22]|uniref:Trigger factor n=1 Tax=Candidatus Spechtbacteria bacterium RIFCSPLOWO2_12_FULL_38_22 TaxID=1802165 RepID=A0A1G2HI72_9BACT|nr:MAG: hypothetical protein A2728_01700 [Candidatus Spechtbacteria bacterium RIFCSPHIGHO2_01_FULL_38_11]OGZ59420.1 MAG: hypothetical protein A3A00_01790 [Candidatus Spechtbacteria bacterium RIFCSPLOWO2_01_FULL_38_20]OGZ60098.1 MAG: hypothetical protein A3E58_02030 [Candidatus Spechtbacteria bacterium RIFCSPHIGHO2_12_FULL_38_30]OGZ62202.1 MAG: hypothetical protein A3F94_02635 [Candidatus Spechtbacteria bacterium RIFCSPLOWO2_12_FULL_38_22]